MTTSNDVLLKKIRLDLIKLSDSETKINAKRFFKEEIQLYGIKAPDIHHIAKNYFKLIKYKPKDNIFAICEELWKSGIHEEGIIASRFSYSIHKKYEPDDLNIFESWIGNFVSNWALCDTLCNHNVGTLIEMYPGKINTLKKWAISNNRWMRRAAAVSLIVPGKKGKFLPEIFEIADLLLKDKDDLVQKGYGWLLKVASVPHQNKVGTYVMQNKEIMPRTALRYAIEKMPEDFKEMAMKK